MEEVLDTLFHAYTVLGIIFFIMSFFCWCVLEAADTSPEKKGICKILTQSFFVAFIIAIFWPVIICFLFYLIFREVFPSKEEREKRERLEREWNPRNAGTPGG